MPHNTPIIVGELHEAGLKIEFDANAAYVKFERNGETLTRVFVHSAERGHSTACFDAQRRLVDYDEEAADTWLRYLGNGYPQPVEAAWLELDEMGRSLGPKKPRD